jgi:N-hydroxyarylamine O-acetyltransferase
MPDAGNSPMNLDAYFHRIGYAGAREPTLPVLRDILFRHTCTIPFENLDVLLGRGVSLADADVERKLVTEARGGYCFEQNSLLMRVLTELGFAVTPLSARVRLNHPREFTPPRTHLWLAVEVRGVRWLADVGIGGYSPGTPLRLDVLNDELATPYEPRRVVMDPHSPTPKYYHQVKLGDTWADVYEFTGDEMPAIDRELANWWTSTSPASHFRHNVLVGLARPDGTRFGLSTREFVHRRGAEVLERVAIQTADELLMLLAERFGLRFPPGTRFGAVGG